jgi:hypothetical protein
MAREGDFGKCDVSIRQKLQYENYMRGKPDATHPNEIELNQEVMYQINNSTQEASD